MTIPVDAVVVVVVVVVGAGIRLRRGSPQQSHREGELGQTGHYCCRRPGGLRGSRPGPRYSRPTRR